MTGDPAAALFLAPAAGRSDALVDALAAQPLPGDWWIGARIERDLPKTNPGTGATLPLLPCPFAAIVLAHGPAGETPETFRGLLGRIAESIDPVSSVLLAGARHVVKPGEGAVLVTMLVRRRADFTPAAFCRRWIEGHAPFGLRIPASGYFQLHAAGAPSAGLPADGGFDGAGMVLFRDADHMTAARATPEIARDATRDEMRFIDHAQSMLAMFQLIGQAVAGAGR